MANENQCGFAKAVNEYLATHCVAGLSDWNDFQKYAAAPAVKGTVDATVQPCHKARRVRFWGAIEHLPVMRGWGLDVGEFDPDASARGCNPDVIICHLEPNYSQGDIEQILCAVRRGTHFVTLQNTDKWSDALAKRFGHTYKGVLGVRAPQDAVLFPNDKKLFAGFPEGRLDAMGFAAFKSHPCGMFMTGERCLLGIADAKRGNIGTAIAQYRYGKGAITLVGPFVNPNDMQAPDYKRLLLNLVTLLPPVGAAVKC